MNFHGWDLEVCEAFNNVYSFEDVGGVSTKYVVRATYPLDEAGSVELQMYGCGDTVEEAKKDAVENFRKVVDVIDFSEYLKVLDSCE